MMKTKIKALTCLIFGTLASVEVQASALGIKEPSPGRAIDTIETGIQSVARSGNKIILGLNDKQFFIKTPFKGFKGDSEQSFGTLLESERIKLDVVPPLPNWQGIVPIGNKILMFDGNLGELVALDAEKLYLISKRSVAWDELRPAADRGGEPTKSEIQAGRSAFKKGFYAQADERFTGLAYDSYGWLGKDGSQFFVASTIPGFPLLTMRCDPADISSCQIERYCFVEGLPKDIRIAGVAIGGKHRDLLLLDQNGHRIFRMKFQSCFRVLTEKSVMLSPKIKKTTGIYLDSENQLWISTQYPDNYLNASVFSFPLDELLGFSKVTTKDVKQKQKQK